jgi:hypothetical protein
MSTPLEIKAPYKGLIPYSAEDAEFFFGREREQNFITANLLAERLTLLYGASGVGKSSVLRAGVEHHLQLLTQENLERLGKPKYVVAVFNEWREPDPVRSVLLKVEEAVTRTLKDQKVEPVSSSLPFTEALLEWSKRARGQLLIILDQFEEYFLYHGDGDGEGTFAVEFPRAVKNTGLPANFLVSFREDAFAKLAFFKVRMPDVFGNYLLLDHLDHDAGRDAIMKPIDQYNQKWANDKELVTVEPALVDEVLRQVQTGQVLLGEAGRGILKKETTGAQIETPFLQMVMMRLWEDEMNAGSPVLRRETLDRLADATTNETGAERIVRTHLDKTMKALTPENQDIAAAAFHYLVTPGGTKIAHTIPDLAEYAKLPQTQLAPVLEELAAGDMRILRGVADKQSAPRYEIFHDVLAAPVLDWRTRRVREQEQEAATRRVAEQKIQAAIQAREEEKAKAANRVRWFAAILSVISFFAVAGFIWAWDERSKARQQAQKAAAAELIAQEERQRAQGQSKLLAAQVIETEQAKARVEAERNRADRERLRAVGQSRIAMTNAEIADKSRKKVLEYSKIKARLSEDELEAFRLWRVENKLPEALAKYRQVLANYALVGETKKQQELQAQIDALTSTLAQSTK